MRPPTRARWRTAAAVAVLALVTGCGVGDAEPPAPAAAAPTELRPTRLAVPDNLAEDVFATPRDVLVPAGWTISLWASVPGARLAAWAPDGALLVSRPEQGDITRLVARAGGGVAASVLLERLTQPHGMAFDDNTLYVAESNRIQAYDYADGAAERGRVVADGLPDARSGELGGAFAHALKSVAVDPDGAVYFSIGSSGNISAEDREAVPEAASILRVPPGGGPAEVFARGVRNGTGLAVAPDGEVWTAVNGRDDIAYPFDRDYPGSTGSAQGEVLESYVADHPAEPLARLTPGRDLGWPYCNPDPDVEPGVPGTALDHSAPAYVPDIETNPDGSALDCAALTPVEQSMGAHSAPLGLAFATDLPTYGTGALVGVHGSWNRVPPRAPEVAFFPYVGGEMGAQQTLVGGFQAADGSRWGRPVAAVQGPDGAVYVTDDDAGAVYRLAPPGVSR
jgi:glucose/arabinose dehydrogenase